MAALVGVAIGAGMVSAQNLGEIARQEQQRRVALAAPTRVLTNEDFRRGRILSPAECGTRNADSNHNLPNVECPAPAWNAELTNNLSTIPDPQFAIQGFSLGEYARRLRAERARRQAEAQAAASPSAPALGQSAARPSLGGGEPESVAYPRHSHVFTNEDFELPRVLDAAPEYARALAAPRAPIPLAESGPALSLGEYARRRREQRAIRQAETELAAKRAAVPESRRAPTKSRNTAPEPPVLSAGQDAGPTGAVLIQVRRGDSLWKISSAHLGEGKLWTLLWKANPEVRNPNLIYPGQTLRRPEEEALARLRNHDAQKVKRAAAGWRQPAPANGSHPRIDCTAQVSTAVILGAPRNQTNPRVSRIPTVASHRRGLHRETQLSGHFFLTPVERPEG